MEDQIDQAEMMVEEGLMRAPREQLLEMAKGLNIEAVDETTRKPKLLRTLRTYIQANQGDDENEILEFLTKFSTALKEIADEEANKSTNAPTEENEVREVPPPVATDATNQLAAALQAMMRPTNETSTLSTLYKQPLKILGTIGDGKEGKNNINYTNLCSQINDAKQSGYKDPEIARAVKKAVTPSSHLRTYFDTDDKITLSKIMTMIRDYFREKTSNELFTELGTLCQTPLETPTDFLIRAFQLRQKVMAASKVEGGMYDARLVQNTFCRAVRTGLLNDQVRAHMKSCLDPGSHMVKDEVLLREMNAASSEYDETSSKMKRATVKRVSINESRVVNHDDLSPIIQGITMLRQQMDEMRTVNKPSYAYNEGASSSREGNQSNQERNSTNQYSRRTSRSPARSYKCKKCKEDNVYRCQHCFNCGSEEHQMRNCKQSKNGNGL